MPVTIGAKPSPDFSSPLELLSDCHRRIERFLAVLIQIATRANGRPMSVEERRALEQALEYFRNAAPRHTADEEESLFPRLRNLNRPEINDALAEVEELEADHATAAKLHDEVDHLCRKWLLENELEITAAQRLKLALADLDKLYRRHIAVEDDRLFPIAQSVLRAPDKVEIGNEMARRRGLNSHRQC
ncbi:MAG: hemerythrin domain-containing protein [Acidobacteriaceae bacterium]|nr:hemerythrin domain-containing protein [Acidobacteriaceae bacterium]MBV9782118.1 hemerythrin domain-containing protein [Acidobacteriaceae bacterium]